MDKGLDQETTVSKGLLESLQDRKDWKKEDSSKLDNVLFYIGKRYNISYLNLRSVHMNFTWQCALRHI